MLRRCIAAAVVIGRRIGLCGDGVCFTNVFRIDYDDTSKSDLYETLTHDLYRSAIEHIKRFFRYSHPEKRGPKTTYFRRLRNSMATLRTNISSKKHGIDNRETALETTKGPLHCPKFRELQQLKIGTEFLPTLVYSSSLPGVAHGGPPKELNQTLPNGRR